MNLTSRRDPFVRLAPLLLPLVLTACAVREPVTALAVHSPPTPILGSVPIAAYDDYARAVMRSSARPAPAVAQAGSP